MHVSDVMCDPLTAQACMHEYKHTLMHTFDWMVVIHELVSSSLSAEKYRVSPRNTIRKVLAMLSTYAT